MPAELKRYVLNVLNYLGKNSDEFRGRLWEDDEEWKEDDQFLDWLDKHMKHLHGQESSSSEDSFNKFSERQKSKPNQSDLPPLKVESPTFVETENDDFFLC